MGVVLASTQTIQTVPPSSLLVCPTIVFRVLRKGEPPEEPGVVAVTNIQFFPSSFNHSLTAPASTFYTPPSPY